MKKRFWRGWFFLTVVLLGTEVSRPSYALVNFTPGDVSSLLDDSVKVLIKTVAIGADHRAYMPASPQGVALGFDLGLDVTTIQIPSEFKTAMQLAGVTSTIPDLLPLPRLNIHKGLPWGFDLGFSYISYDPNKLIGVEIKWAFIRGGMVLPSVALRLSETLARLYFMHTRTYKIDVVASKKMGWFMDPYVGMGLQLASGDLDVPIGGPGGLSTTLSQHESFSPMHAYVGIPLKFVLMTLTGEYDYSFSGVSVLGLKASLAL